MFVELARVLQAARRDMDSHASTVEENASRREGYLVVSAKLVHNLFDIIESQIKTLEREVFEALGKKD